MKRTQFGFNHPLSFSFILACLLQLTWGVQGCKNLFSDKEAEMSMADSIRKHAETVATDLVKAKLRPRTAEDIVLTKAISFEQYTLEDEYEVDGKPRHFQWDKIKEKLAWIETFQIREKQYAVLQNYKNLNGEAPLVKKFVRNEYTRVSDTLGTERYQSVPLYLSPEEESPEIYAKDGSLVAIRGGADSLDYYIVEGLSFEGHWTVPKQYVKLLGKDKQYNQVIVVDVTHQHLCTLEKKEKEWHILSMNPATTGIHQPPFAHETPLGIFVIQEKKEKMYFLKDGSKTEIAGFAPFASRFTNGGYLHGIPTNYPDQGIIEYSWTLGTTPRSHMCVRNASSHSKFIYDWSKTWETLVVVIE